MPTDIIPFAVEHTDPATAIAWPLPVDASNPAQISAKDAGAS